MIAILRLTAPEAWQKIPGLPGSQDNDDGSRSLAGRVLLGSDLSAWAAGRLGLAPGGDFREASAHGRQALRPLSYRRGARTRRAGRRVPRPRSAGRARRGDPEPA